MCNVIDVKFTVWYNLIADTECVRSSIGNSVLRQKTERFGLKVLNGSPYPEVNI